jgi:integrase
VDRHGVPRPAANEREALRFLRDRRRDVEGGRLLGPQEERITVEEILDALFTHLAAKSPEAAKKDKRRSHAKPVREFFAFRRAVDVTAADLDRLIRERRGAGRAAATINRELEVLRQAYRLAIDHNRLSSMRVPKVTFLPVDNVREGFFEPAEIKKLLPHLDPDLRDFVEWASITGQRKGEAAALTWPMLRRSGNVWTLHIPGRLAKNREGRTLPVVGSARSVIERRLAARRVGCELIFHRESKGKPAQPIKAFDKAWVNALEAAGLPKDRLFHDLRRSAARNLRRSGVSETAAMKITGHKTPSMFRRYSIVSDEETAAALLAVDRAKANSHI